MVGVGEGPRGRVGEQEGSSTFCVTMAENIGDGGDVRDRLNAPVKRCGRERTKMSWEPRRREMQQRVAGIEKTAAAIGEVGDYDHGSKEGVLGQLSKISCK